MPYLLPRRGGLFTDPPLPGGEGAGSTVPSIKDPASPPAWKGCPLDPRSGAPGQAVERTGESPKVTISPPIPAGGGLSTGHTGRGGMLYTIPPSNAPPPDGPEGLPLRPPASTPGQAVERTGQSLKAPYLSPEPGASPTTPPAGGTWLSSAYHPKPRRQIDRDGATPAKEGATLLGKTKAPGPIAPPPPASGNPPHAPSANWRRGDLNLEAPRRQTPPFYAARMPPWLLNQLASRPTAQIRAQGPPSGFPPPSARRCRIS
ncbi:hypothetical protein N7530_013043 [Penicillium desertorum]|uniref:Uncharacterized protein n=1 Tax=Penicillium desertorum TaxID=1303715 RepID=A0A9X0BFB2_9EURO|nr:hypothetical protein N7530_013043 [Penicillium desertorum]